MSTGDPVLKPFSLTGIRGPELLTATQAFHQNRPLAETFHYRITKRAFEVLLVLAILPLLLPVVAIVCAVVACTSTGPVLYGHSRFGRNGKVFRIWKFRTMHVDNARIFENYLRSNPLARKEWQHSQKLKDDPRITATGLILRRYSLDELPQLWNVLNGTMSLIGPRPITSEEIAKYGPNFTTYCSVDPGLTGLWQISGRSDLTYRERVILDCEYVELWSLSKDLKILSQTLSAVLSGRGAY